MIKSFKSNLLSLDAISSNVLQFCCDAPSKPLSCIINNPIYQGIIPLQLKKTQKFIPNISEVSNIRPISVTLTVSQLREKIALKRLLDNSMGNELMTPNQHGFRGNKPVWGNFWPYQKWQDNCRYYDRLKQSLWLP